MIKSIVAALALVALTFSGCSNKPDETAVDGALNEIYAKNFEELAGQFEIKSQITDSKEWPNGLGYDIFFDYVVTIKADINTSIIDLSNPPFHERTWDITPKHADRLKKFGLLPENFMDGLLTKEVMFAATLGVVDQSLFDPITIIPAGAKFHCAENVFEFSQTDSGAWRLGGSSIKKCKVPPEVEAAIKAEAERRKAEAKRQKAEREAELAAELAKPLVPVQELPTIKNSVGMEFVLIPAGSFQMGISEPCDDPANKKAVALGKMKCEWGNAVKPRHKVTISKPFYIAKTPRITPEIYYDVMGKAPPGGVSSFDFDAVRAFIDALNKLEKTNKYRLPTEAELEYAMRAGTDALCFWGRNTECEAKERDNDLSWKKYNEGHPNQWGLSYVYYYQWTSDSWADYPAQDQVDPKVVSKSYAHVLRGRNSVSRSESNHQRNIYNYLRIVKEQ
ncbi:MAG: formylglycine-generating enzyme family protein [Helicobacteraceae bacterium]|jgi:formylglycine-generating enzyme required for sulfatase activity|nr:formylglycine-generating enzyme family protein [Helicobacteraceae bacterium]